MATGSTVRSVNKVLNACLLPDAVPRAAAARSGGTARGIDRFGFPRSFLLLCCVQVVTVQRQPAAVELESE